MVTRRNANDVVYACVQPLHESTTSPAGTQNHHPGFLAGDRRAEAGRARQLRRLRRRIGNGMGAKMREEEGGRKKWVGICGSEWWFSE